MEQMKCRFSHKLNAYIDGELSRKEFGKVKDHLLECTACQAEMREINSINSFLSSYQEEDVPEYLNQRILATVQERGQEKVKFGFSRQLVNFSIAASVMLSFVTGILLSDLTYTKTFSETSVDNLEFGQETLYSFFEGGE